MKQTSVHGYFNNVIIFQLKKIQISKRKQFHLTANYCHFSSINLLNSAGNYDNNITIISIKSAILIM